MDSRRTDLEKTQVWLGNITMPDNYEEEHKKYINTWADSFEVQEFKVLYDNTKSTFHWNFHFIHWLILRS